MTAKTSTKNSPFKHFVTLNNKRYEYQLIPQDKESTKLLCQAANINQSFLNADIPALLVDLPNLILAEKEYAKKNDQVIRFRVSQEDKQAIEKKAAAGGHATVSSYLRELALS